jgi:hypothetical protein
MPGMLERLQCCFHREKVQVAVEIPKVTSPQNATHMYIQGNVIDLQLSFRFNLAKESEAIFHMLDNVDGKHQIVNILIREGVAQNKCASVVGKSLAHSMGLWADLIPGKRNGFRKQSLQFMQDRASPGSDFTNTLQLDTGMSLEQSSNPSRLEW